MQKLLLHVCCAPCSTSVIESLINKYNVSLFFYNPNIHPLSEQEKRKTEASLYAKKKGMAFYQVKADVRSWFEQVKEVRWSTERSGKRCHYCYYDRLKQTAAFAKAQGFDLFATTLTISPYKHTKMINSLGLLLAEEVGVEYLESDFKKNDGYLRSIKISQNENMYRQNYCGCVYSKLERLRIKPYN